MSKRLQFLWGLLVVTSTLHKRNTSPCFKPFKNADFPYERMQVKKLSIAFQFQFEFLIFNRFKLCILK